MASTVKKTKLADVGSAFAEGSIKRLYLENFVYVGLRVLLAADASWHE